MTDLTDRQKEILDFIMSYARQHGYPPTFREIGGHFGFTWPASKQHLKAIERKGYISLIPTKSRGIEILGSAGPSQGRMIPVAGRIRAGQPILAYKDIDDHIFVDTSLFPAEDAFSLKVTGDSMVEAGIYNGDYIVVRPQQTLDNGEIGVVLIEDEATVKRFFKDKKSVTLRPENSSMKPMTYKADQVYVVGKVMGVIRKL